MKNFKKVIALGSAVMMSLTMSVSAFAAAGTATASYKDGFVKLSGTEDINAENQWTVVVISKADQNATLTADKLYYINQGTSGDTFWTNGMGTKVELEDGDYIVRIGGETITSAEDLIEIEFSISTTPAGVTVQLGDTNGDGTVNASDVSPVIQHILQATLLEGSLFVAGDTNVDGSINASDISPIIQHILEATLLGTGTYTPAK